MDSIVPFATIYHNNNSINNDDDDDNNDNNNNNNNNNNKKLHLIKFFNHDPDRGIYEFWSFGIAKTSIQKNRKKAFV